MKSGRIIAIIIIIGLCFVALPLLMGISYSVFFPSTHQNLTEIRIATVPFTNSALIWAAENKSLFHKYGLNVTLIMTYSGLEAADKLITGEADIATVAEFIPMYLAYQSPPINDTLILGSISTDEFGFLVGRADRGIFHADDLAGKRIGTMKDTVLEFYLDRYIRLHNLTGKVTIMSLDPDNLYKLFLNGDLDAAVCWELPLYQAEQKFGENNLTILPVQGNSLAYWLLMMEKNWYAKHNAAAVSLLRALNDAQTVVGKDPELIPKILGNKFGYNVTFLSGRKEYHHYILSLDQPLLMAMEEEGRWILQRNRINQTKASSALNLIESGPMQEIYPEGVTIWE